MLETEKGIKIEIKTNNKLHDRYILDSNNVWTLGTSINSLGKNDSTLSELPEIKHDLEDLFKERWEEGNKLE